MPLVEPAGAIADLIFLSLDGSGHEQHVWPMVIETLAPPRPIVVATAAHAPELTR